MKHIVDIYSKSQNGFTTIEDHVVVTEEEIEQLALDKHKRNIDDNEGKSWWALIAKTIHD